MHFHRFSDEFIALQQEIATGYHPQLYPVLAVQQTLEDYIATICTHLGVVIDGAFSEKGMNKLYTDLTQKLILVRENPDGIILLS